jgi:hypothetical protein
MAGLGRRVVRFGGFDETENLLVGFVLWLGRLCHPRSKLLLGRFGSLVYRRVILNHCHLPVRLVRVRVGERRVGSLPVCILVREVIGSIGNSLLFPPLGWAGFGLVGVGPPGLSVRGPR